MAAVAIAIPAAAAGGIGRAVVAGVLGGVVFGIGLNWLETRGRFRLSRLGNVPTDVPVYPVLEIEVTGSADRVLSTLETAIRSIVRGGRSVLIERMADGLAVALPSTLRHGYGEQIEVVIRHQQSGDKLKVLISSRPRTHGVWVDLGRNYGHVLTLRNALQDDLGSAAIRDLSLTDASESGQLET